MNKKGFLARDYIIALILFSGVFALLALMSTSLASDYGNTDIIDENLESHYNNLEENTEIASQMFSAAQEKEGISFLQTFDVLFSAGFTVIALVFSSVSNGVLYTLSFGEDFGIPLAVSAIFFSIIVSILMVILVFVIISTTTRRDF